MQACVCKATTQLQEDASETKQGEEEVDAEKLAYAADAAPTSSYGCKCGRMDTMQQSWQRLDVPAAHASSLWKCVQRGEHVAAVVASKTTTPLMKERELFLFLC